MDDAIQYSAARKLKVEEIVSSDERFDGLKYLYNKRYFGLSLNIFSRKVY